MRATSPPCQLSAYVEQTFATELLAGGARRLGYLLEERVGRVEQFLEALHRVADGGTAIDPDVVAQLFARDRPRAELEKLTAREREVLALVAEGLGNSAIAGRLFVTEGAVHEHIRPASRLGPFGTARGRHGGAAAMSGVPRG